MILGYSAYELLWLFFIYGFIGWCVEVAYCGVDQGYFSNRGFLNGPICPIYGVGAVIVILCLTPIQDNIWLLFVGSALLTSLLELVTGFALDKIFHARWWDYTDKPFNIGGYICLKFSIYWGLVCIALMRGIHPAIYKLVQDIPHIAGLIILIFISAVFAVDIVITVVAINKLEKRIKLMDDIAEKIHNVSDEMGEHIYDGVTAVVKKGEEIYNSDNARELREKYTEGVEELKRRNEETQEELREKYAQLVKESHIFQKRILKAFPKIKSRRHEEQLEKLKERVNEIKSKMKK
ncbi:MAG: hypothetical protein LIO53_00945 [Oscillospiraceae bacterium]|nr:hypothetical protein [Oscillospiraceae bacterium]